MSDNPLERFSKDDLPPAGQGEEVYLHYLQSLHGASNSWDRSKGWLSWLQGQALNRLVDGIRLRACERGAYRRILEQIGMKKSTAWYCRRIATKCTADEARALGYTQLLYRIKAMRESGQKGTGRDLIQRIGAIRKRMDDLDRMELGETVARIAGPDYGLAIEHLATIAQTAQRAINELERRRRGAQRVRQEPETVIRIAS